MSKKQKKRNKKYTGAESKTRDDVVRIYRATAVVRSDFKQWIHDRRVLIRNVAIGVAVVIVIVAGIWALVK